MDARKEVPENWDEGSPEKMEFLQNNFDQMEQAMQSPKGETDFHMILRSPQGNQSYPSSTPSKSRRSSKKKAKKTPSKPLTEEDIVTYENTETIDNFYPDQSSEQLSRTSTPKKDVIPLPSKFKVARTRSLGRARSSLYAPTKSTLIKVTVKVGARNSTGTVASGSSGSSVGTMPRKRVIHQSKGPTIPLTPHFKSDERSRMHVKSAILSTEDREMLVVEEARKVEEERVKKAKKVFLWVKRHSSNVVKTIVRSTKELTIPTTPVSHLMKRKGQKVCSNESGPIVKEEEKIEESFHNRAPTQFEPFQFATDSRSSIRSTDHVEAPEVSVAEAAAKFFRDPRSHGAPKVTLTMTEGRAPRFMTEARCNKGPKIMSTEEMEEQAFKEMQEKGIKAKPVDKRIFNSMGELGVPKVPAKKATEQVPFELRSVHRVRASSVIMADVPSSVFKARPMPAFHDMAPRTPIVTKQLTVAVSPKMNGGPRASSAPARRQRAHHTVVEEERRVAAALAAAPTPMKMTLTDPREFHLATNDRGFAYKAQLEQRERLEAQREKEARNVKANPVPDSSRAYHVQHSAKELTEFKEFNLRSVVLHGSDQLAQKLETQRSEEALKEKMHFQARSLPRSTFEPDFQLEAENKPPTVAIGMNFESDARAEKRREFDEMMAVKMTQLEEQKELAARRRLDAENLKIRELRKMSVCEGGMTFKAGPIITKDMFPSRHVVSAPLTEPKAPSFSTMTHRGSVYGSTSKESEMAAAFQQM